MRAASLIAALLCLILLAPPPLVAEEAIAPSGQVQIPLDAYNKLMEQLRDPRVEPRDAPAPWALGDAAVEVQVTEVAGRAAAAVHVQLSVEVLEDDWILMPVLPPGTAVSSAQIGSNPILLLSTPQGLSWATKARGTHLLDLKYQVDAHASEGGFAAAIPTPAASSMRLSATLPGKGLDAALVPGADARLSSSGESTTLSATIPTTTAVLLSWRGPRAEGHAISRARYTGALSGEAVAFEATFGVEQYAGEAVNLALLPQSLVLREVKVDGKPSAIATEGGWFVTPVQGRGAHEIQVSFQVPITRADGPPKLTIPIPQVPVSRFDLTLPGKKDLTVSPMANVSHVEKGADTVSTFYVPLTSSVTIQWSEAIPEDIQTEVRANASLYHLAHAEEGVLYLRAMAAWDVTRGETSTFELLVPKGAQINRITSEDGGVGDWRLTAGRGSEPDRVTVFLDRKVSGEYRFDVTYERLLGTGDQKEAPVDVPLIRADGVGRQRGMVSLLASKELAVKPDVEGGLTRVGENQLPAWVRQAVDMTIAHSFKYVDPAAVDLKVHAAPPERKQGRFDAQVDTLISIGDVTMKGAATLEVNVKSGTTMDLTLGVPAEVNILSLSAPSLRTWKVETEGGAQSIDVQFTQEMEGQFRIEVTYERIMSEGVEEVTVPTLSVGGAEVEQGRIAVEALTAVEVQTARTAGLSTLDTSELPKQLILKTTNPILLAYKYVQSDTPSQLSLKVTRHSEIAVQDAIIDQALYRTLYTPDGLAVTSARFMVRNSRKQFLKVQLPKGSEVWKAWVDGAEEKPALAAGGEESGGPNVLIKIINSAQGFPVDLIYTTPISRIGRLGTIQGKLPRPDMIATRSRWDVYVPDTLSYQEPESNMRLLEGGLYISSQRMAEEIADGGGEGKPVADAMRIMVPTNGVRFSFEKLYANQSDDEAVFTIPYATSEGATAAMVVSFLGALLAWLGLGSLLIRWRSRSLSLGAVGVGAALVAVTVGYLGIDTDGALAATGLAALGAAAWLWRSRQARRRGWDEPPPPSWGGGGGPSPGTGGATSAPGAVEDASASAPAADPGWGAPASADDDDADPGWGTPTSDDDADPPGEDAAPHADDAPAAEWASFDPDRTVELKLPEELRRHPPADPQPEDADAEPRIDAPSPPPPQEDAPEEAWFEDGGDEEEGEEDEDDDSLVVDPEALARQEAATEADDDLKGRG